MRETGVDMGMYLSVFIGMVVLGVPIPAAAWMALIPVAMFR